MLLEVEEGDLDIRWEISPGAAERFPHVYGAIPLAGLAELGLFDMTATSFDRHMAVNVRATLLLCQAFALQFGGSLGSGRIVNFVTGPPQNGAVAYAASKGAIHWLSVSIGAELAPRGITVNTVNPGPNDASWMSPETYAQIDRESPLARDGLPRDTGKLVAFLCSGDAGWITGQTLTSDGGWSTLRG